MDWIVEKIFLLTLFFRSEANTELLSSSDSSKIVDVYSYCCSEEKEIILFNDSTFNYYWGNNHNAATLYSSGTYRRTDSSIILQNKMQYRRRKQYQKVYQPNEYVLRNDTIFLYNIKDTSKMEEWEIRHSKLIRNLNREKV
ncbi:MAG: hypothetical protein RL660_2340 [Bacteroidota bacterium]|jgi:hypothetical protein